jgi:threonine synthase
VPCAGGSLITKIWKAIKELKTLGLIDGERGTKMYAAQAEGCGPIVTMVREGSDVLVPVRPRTIAKSLAIGNPADGYYAAQAVRESGGWAAHATDEEIVETMELLARTEGIFAETAGGVTLAATRKLVAEGRIGRDESVVVCITGSGLKTVEALEDRVAEPLRVGASLSAVESLLPDLQSITTR